MKRIALFAAAAILPAAVLAAGGATTTALLGRVPAMPHDAPSAYGQWSDSKGDLTPGALYKALENDIRTAIMAPMARQQAAVNDIASKYATPAGQAELKNMTLEQKMALAQQMQQAQMGGSAMGAAVVSPNDGALLRRMQPNPATIQLRTKMADVATRLGQIEQQWQGDDARLGTAEVAEMSKLPICKGEAGEPSEADIRRVKLAYADKHIALAATYLPKYQALENDKRGFVVQETRQADDALAAWSALSSPALKSQMQPMVVGSVANAANDVGAVLSIVEAGSKRAAGSVAQKKQYELQYANAKGC